MPQFNFIQYIGGMDLDTSLSVFPKGYTSYARNIEYKGFKGNKIVQNIDGNRILFSALPAGNNLCIGKYFDKKNNNLYWFNWNSNNSHAIYIMNMATYVTTTLIQSGVNTQGDILQFTPTTTINSIWIFYGDPNVGDILNWVDSLGRPSQFNIQQYLGLLPSSPAYSSIKRGFIDVAKAPPRMSPKCTFENDFLVTANLLTGKLPQFRCRYVFDNLNKSVFSQPSEIPLPNLISYSTLTPPVQQNCRVRVYIPTGDVDVTAVELWVKIYSDSAQTDWQLIQSFNKKNNAIPDNSIFQYLFYNNVVLTNGPVEEINQIQDYVPPKCICGNALNGNVASYGGITEGYPNPTVNATVSSSLATTVYNSLPGLAFFAAQGAYDTNGSGVLLTIFLSGAGNNDGSGNPSTIQYINAQFTVDCVDNNGNSIKFTYNNGSNVAISNVLNGLSTAAQAQGFAFITSTPNSITLGFTNGFTLYGQTVTVPIGDVNSRTFAAYPYLLYNTYSVVYFDDKGRTPGATIFTGNGFNTGIDLQGGSVPQQTISINSRPPSWAKYFCIGRGSNTPPTLYWVSNQVFVNTNLVTGQQYAYIGISNMGLYNADLSASTPVVKYDFAPGDRIQFLIRYPISGAASILSANNDYEIVAVEDNPSINGVNQPGSFIKIVYPASDINGNFAFTGDNFQNYGVRIHKQFNQVSSANTIYYEYGKMFAIGNYGLSNPYHIGDYQTQKPDLSQPAIIIDNAGDSYFKFRNVPAGNVYSINVFGIADSVGGGGSGYFGNGVALIPATSQSVGNVINDPIFRMNQQTNRPGLSNAPTFAATDYMFYNESSNPIILRCIGSPQFACTLSGSVSVYFNTWSAAGDANNYLFANFQISQSPVSGGVLVQKIELNLDNEVVIPAQSKAWFSYYFQPGDRSNGYTISVSGFSMIFEVVNLIQQFAIEPSFSDKANITANSNGRAFIYDQNAATIFYGDRYRYSLPYQKDTSLNNTNRFYPLNYDTVNRAYGDIIRMVDGPGKNLLIFQQKRVGIIGVYNKFIINNQGQIQMILSDAIITANNIQYYEYDYGIQNQPDCIVQNGNATYFVDVIKGYIVRLAQDGEIPISLDYKVQTWAGDTLPAYFSAANGSYQGNGRARIVGCFHLKTHSNPEYVLVAQQGTGVNGDILRFDEKDNAFTSFQDGTHDMIECCGNRMFSWNNGVLYIHSNESAFCNFNGVQYYPSVQHIFNIDGAGKYTFNTIGYKSNNNNRWVAPNPGDIFTDMANLETNLIQQSSLILQDFTDEEVYTYGAFLRDSNSGPNPILALLDGDVLKGSYISVKLTYKNIDLNYLTGTYISYTDSPLNPK